MKRKKNTNRILVLLISAALVALIVASFFAPQPIDWSYSFSKSHSKPLGNKLLFNVIETLFPNQNLIVVNSTLKEFLNSTKPVNTNFIYINNVYNADSLETKKLLTVAEAGNNIFIAAEIFSNLLTDTLKLKINNLNPPLFHLENNLVGFNFTNKKLKNIDFYWYDNVITNNYFAAYDSLKTTVLGYNNKGYTNFIKVAFGDGNFYLNCNPVCFTNYHLLSDNKSEYIFKCLSYLPVTSTVWDENIKAGAAQIGSEINFILINPALRISWYLLILSILLFFIFQGKRRQRPVPIIKPPENQSLSFIETISHLYFIKNDHIGIARKRFLFFRNFLREKYFINLNANKDQIIQEITKKSGIPERSVSAIFQMAENLNKIEKISKEDLQQFNRQLEFFYNNCR